MGQATKRPMTWKVYFRRKKVGQRGGEKSSELVSEVACQPLAILVESALWGQLGGERGIHILW